MPQPIPQVALQLAYTFGAEAEAHRQRSERRRLIAQHPSAEDLSVSVG